MKLKKLFSAIGLGLFAVASVSAGVLAFAKGPKVEQAKAEGEDWMFRIQINMREASNWDGDGEISNLRFHYWGKDNGEDYNETVGLPLMNGNDKYGQDPGDNEAVYGTNVVLPATKNITGGCFILDQVSGADRYSNDLEDCAFSAGEDTWILEYAYSNWPDTKWNAVLVATGSRPQLKADNASGVFFTANPAQKRWELKDYVYDSEGSNKYFHFIIGNNFASSVVATDSFEALATGGDYSTCWVHLNDSGTYDFYLYDAPAGNGQMVIQKQGVTSTSYVYYITGETTPTVNYVFARGGVQQFGAWPGQPVATVGTEVTGSRVLQFNGEDVLIYRIPIKAGYEGDTRLIINYQGEPKAQSSEKSIIIGAAFKWGDATMNYDMGAALDFLTIAETARNAVTAHDDIKAYSVCGISKAKATELVNDYNGLTADRRAYVDSSNVLTYRRDGEEGNEMVSYRVVMEQLAKIAEIALVGPSQTITFGYQTNGTMLIAIITVITTISVAGVFALVVIRKRKHH